MGLNPFWQEDVFITLQGFQHQIQMLDVNPYFIIDTKKNFLIHLIPVDNSFSATELIDLQLKYQSRNQHLIQLWEDIWLSKRSQVLSRFKSFLGLNEGFHARKGKIYPITFKQAFDFLESYHLQGFVSAKYNIGLFNDEELIAVASFSRTRPMPSKGDHYFSAELVRFASKDGITVVGGLSKLIKYFLKGVKMDDLMTYADRDWSLGKGYEKLDFILSEATESLSLFLDTKTLARFTFNRLPEQILTAYEKQHILSLEDFLALNCYKKIFNTGNLKYHLYL